MKFRKRLFWTLAFLTILFMLAWMSGFAKAVDEDRAENDSAAQQLGTDVGEGIGNMIIFCVTLPMFFFFALMGWRNGAGLDKEKKHVEMLGAMQERGQDPG